MLRWLIIKAFIAALFNTASLVKATAVVAMPTENALQDVITWDEYSWLVNNERIMLYSGEFHPWRQVIMARLTYTLNIFLHHVSLIRLPNPSLYLDIFQKIKALGFNAVQTYINWSLIEAERGVFRADGIFSWDPFFVAAKQSGLFVIVRPGPYINAEVSSGGFPGWRFHDAEGLYWRVSNQSYYNTIKPYIDYVGNLVAPYQITNNGSVILLQLENELSSPAVPGTQWPATDYMDFLGREFQSSGLIVPTFHNDVAHLGNFANATFPNVYAYDYYPISCGSLPNTLPQSDWTLYEKYSPTNPHMIAECGDGYYDQWGGLGYNNCDTQLNAGIQRLFYKNRYSMATTSLNLYMIYGGTNWGHLSWHRVYTSYDYRAAIAEDRSITREKYSEIKLEALFLKVSPAYRTSRLIQLATSEFTNTTDVVISRTKDSKSWTTFWVTRKSDFTSLGKVFYTLNIPTSQGNVTIPRLGGNLSLSLNDYDSKIHLSDYTFGNNTILYSTAEILTWSQDGLTTVIVVYGDVGEFHETAFIQNSKSNIEAYSVLEGSIDECKVLNGTITVGYTITNQSVIKFGNNILLYILDRKSAYTIWVSDLATIGQHPGFESTGVIIKGPYLVRNASLSDNTLEIFGDLNATVTVEVIAPQTIDNLKWNGNFVPTNKTTKGSLIGTLVFTSLNLDLPDLEDLTWKTKGSIPEIEPQYNDSKWVNASNTTTVNGARPLTTPTDLYSGTYGYHVGNQLYRGHFAATGNESYLYLEMSGGFAFGFSVWINSTFIGSNAGGSSSETSSSNFTLHSVLQVGSPYVITILMEHMGYNENESGGITLGSSNEEVKWKVTGNLGGEHYEDKSRGPFNEGGFYAERMGWHLPNPPSDEWSVKSPLTGLSSSGVEIYTTNFSLSIPHGYDVPLAINIEGSEDVRVNVFINGFKFARYIQNIGPQTMFSIPEGIINHRGNNYIAVIIWALNSDGGKLTNISLISSGVYETGYGDISAVSQPVYMARTNAF